MKYLFFDIDGTLVSHGKSVTKRNSEALKKARENGHKVYLCTGRAPVSISQEIRKIGFDGIISSAGGFVEVDGEYIYKNAIDKNILAQVLLLFTNQKIMYSLETQMALYQSPGIKDFFEHLMIKKHGQGNHELSRLLQERENEEIRYPISQFDINTIPVTKVVFLSNDRIAFLDCVKYLAPYFNIVIFSDPEDEIINGEIILKDCTKGNGMAKILEYVGGNIDDTIAYGDSMNDYEMIQDANMGVVSKSGALKLKAIADDFFEEPDQDGIAKHLEKIGII